MSDRKRWRDERKMNAKKKEGKVAKTVRREKGKDGMRGKDGGMRR